MWHTNDQITFVLVETGVVVIGTVTYVYPFDNNNVFIHGTVLEGTFSASFYNQIATIRIYYSNHVQYELLKRVQEMYEMNRVNMTDLKEKLLPIPSSKTWTFPWRVQQDFRANLRILVLYTKQAVEDCPGEECILSLISLAIGNYNIALQNSLVNMTVHYVAERIGNYETFIEPASMDTMLAQMGNAISTSRRYVLNCHAVHLTVKNSDYCGIAPYSFNGLTNGNSVTHYGCIGGYMSLAHEVGHNIGLHHDETAYGGGTFNRGYCWDDSTGRRNCRRSIMAYATCKTPLGKTNCDRVAFFSSPHVLDMGNPVGAASSNNAQQIRDNIWRFMNQFSPMFSSGCPTGNPTNNPVRNFTNNPTGNPSNNPTVGPSTKNPTWNPTNNPSRNPTGNISTKNPTSNPSRNPTNNPVRNPTGNPTYNPTSNPVRNPSRNPTYNPTGNPTLVRNPTYNPTGNPSTRNPTRPPSTRNPTYHPSTKNPIQNPTGDVVATSPFPSFSPICETQIPTFQINKSAFSVTILSVASVGLFCLCFVSASIFMYKRWLDYKYWREWRNRKHETMSFYNSHAIKTPEQHCKLVQKRYQVFTKRGSTTPPPPPPSNSYLDEIDESPAFY